MCRVDSSDVKMGIGFRITQSLGFAQNRLVFETLIADLGPDAPRLVLCHGGDKGRGNARFKTATNQAPRRADPGGA